MAIVITFGWIRGVSISNGSKSAWLSIVRLIIFRKQSSSQKTIVLSWFSGKRNAVLWSGIQCSSGGFAVVRKTIVLNREGEEDNCGKRHFLAIRSFSLCTFFWKIFPHILSSSAIFFHMILLEAQYAVLIKWFGCSAEIRQFINTTGCHHLNQLCKETGWSS